jgi:hypothetical protein
MQVEAARRSLHKARWVGSSGEALATLHPIFLITQRDAVDRRARERHSDRSSVTGLMEAPVGRWLRCLPMQHLAARRRHYGWTWHPGAA